MGGTDISVFKDDELPAYLKDVKSMSLFCPKERLKEPRKLAGAVKALCDRGGPAGLGKVVFTDGALVGLGLIRALQALPDHLASTDHYKRVQGALFWALEDGDRRLFCSEFVFRVLTAAGQRPELPVRPIISLDGFPTDEPAEGALVSWLDQLKAFLERVWSDLTSRLGLDDDSRLTFGEVWRAIEEGYAKRERPARIEVANFFAPADFAASPSFRLCGSRTSASEGWVPLGAPPP